MMGEWRYLQSIWLGVPGSEIAMACRLFAQAEAFVQTEDRTGVQEEVRSN